METKNYDFLATVEAVQLRKSLSTIFLRSLETMQDNFSPGTFANFYDVVQTQICLLKVSGVVYLFAHV